MPARREDCLHVTPATHLHPHSSQIHISEHENQTSRGKKSSSGKVSTWIVYWTAHESAAPVLQAASHPASAFSTEIPEGLWSFLGKSTTNRLLGLWHSLLKYALHSTLIGIQTELFYCSDRQFPSCPLNCLKNVILRWKQKMQLLGITLQTNTGFRNAWPLSSHLQCCATNWITGIISLKITLKKGGQEQEGGSIFNQIISVLWFYQLQQHKTAWQAERCKGQGNLCEQLEQNSSNSNSATSRERWEGHSKSGSWGISKTECFWQHKSN